MPLIRKIIAAGRTSRAVILPSSWLRYFEEIEGQAIETVAIEVNKKLTISPIILKKQNNMETQTNQL